MARYRRTSKWTTAGQAEIWLARDQESGEEVVMKRLLPDRQLSDPAAELRRFYREVRSQGALEHPGIMPIIGWNFSADPPWYTMPRAQRNLGDYIDGNPNGLPEQEVIDIMLQVAEAVSHARQEGIYHRDIKPGNILKLKGRWVVADFGLCRDTNTDSVTITKTRAVIGTVAYLAPEQFDNAHAVGAAADIFSMGRTLFHLLTGRVPFPYTNLQMLPSKFVFIVEKALRENPEDRYSSAAEFARELALLADDGESMEVPAERAKALLTNLLSGDADAPRGLLEILISNRDDEVFYREFIPGLPEPALEAMQDTSESGFRTLIEAFDQYSEGSHPFSYTDTIADFFRRIFGVAIDLRLRQLALSRIFVIGYEHNRFYVRTVFFRILSHMSGVQEAQIAVAVINENSAAAEWYSEVLSDYSVPRAVRAAFRAA